MFFSLACYCFLDLHIVSLIRYLFYIYQRRGLMFDVFSIQFSRYGLAHTRYVLPAFCTPSASRNVLTGSFLTAHRMQSMVLYIETAARCSVCLRQTPASLNDTHKSPRSLHSHGFFIRIVCLSNVHPLFCMRACKKVSARLTGLFQ